MDKFECRLPDALVVILVAGLTAYGCFGNSSAPIPQLTEDESDFENFVCAQISDWSATWSLLEEAVLQEVNLRRAEGADCRTTGVFEPTHPLVHNDRLQCAARGHTLNMVENDFFDHVSPDGGDLEDRIAVVGYDYIALGENIALGQVTAEEVVEGWMGSDGHCSNIMQPDYEELGVGYHEGIGGVPVWTQVFGTSF